MRNEKMATCTPQTRSVEALRTRQRMMLRSVVIVMACLPLSEAWSSCLSSSRQGLLVQHQRIRRSPSVSLHASTIDEEQELDTTTATTEIASLEDGTDRSVDVIRILSNDTGHYHPHHHRNGNFADTNGHIETTGMQETNGEEINVSTRSLWIRRHARSTIEGIRREKTAGQLSSLLKKAHQETFHANRRLIARTITGFISAVAEEADGLEVGVSARKGSPIWEKEIESIQINFSRLGFRPLRLGGLDDAVHKLEDSMKSKPISSINNNIKEASSDASSASATLSEDGLEMTDVSCMNEAFERIDADNSGTLDRDEIAMALDVVTASSSDEKLLTSLASELVELYDTNGDGVVDFDEYQLMVEDMAALRQVKSDDSSSVEKKEKEAPANTGRWFNFGWGGGDDTTENVTPEELAPEIEALSAPSPNQYATPDIDHPDDTPHPIKGTGTITLTGLKLDLRRLLFGFLPLVKKITPGGPLVLEPFTATVHGSFSEQDLAQSLLLDDGLRRLVARALRRRVRSVRDIMDGAVFYGRSWNMASVQAPVVEVPELTEITFDKQNRLLVTGRVRIRTSPDAPVIDNAFKLRTKLGTRNNGQVIRLEQPELALVLECPQAWERNIVSICNKFNLTVPTKPDPLYSFFPIYSPFKVEDNDGFDLGPDNCIKSIYIKEGALRFEMQAILRPGRFLGSHYVAFTLPMRTFLITLDRVFTGIKTARKNKREAQRTKLQEAGQSYSDIVAQSLSSQELVHQKEDLKFTEKTLRDGVQQQPHQKKVGPGFKPTKSFFSRFVEGYLGVGKNEVVRNERLTAAISEWFGRQGNNNNSSKNDDIV